MIRSAIKFLLSLCFLFTGGYGHLFAQSHQNITSLSQAIFFENSTPAVIGAEKNNHSILHKAAAFAADDTEIDATELEDDDDEHTACRKYVAFTNYFLTLFYNTVPGNLSQYSKNRLPFCKHFSYAASSKYIVQRVIRI